MNLCLIDPDNLTIELTLKKSEPSIESIDNELVIFENYCYRIRFYCDRPVTEISLFIGEYSVPLVFNEYMDCYETDRGILFNGCFDLTYMSIYIDNGIEPEDVLYTNMIRVATTKQTAERVEEMLREIEENLPNYLEVCFSKSRKFSGIIANHQRSVWHTLKLLDEIIDIYEESHSYFLNHKKSSVEPMSAIVDIKEMQYINLDSLNWIVSHPDNLMETSNRAIYNIGNTHYNIQKVKTQIAQYSYDVYENRVVLGFIKRILEYVEEQINNFHRELSELENMPNNIVAKIPNTHELTAHCVYIYYKGITKKFEEREEKLRNLYYKYQKNLQCIPDIIYNIPRMSNTFKSNYRYRLCYECMIRWFHEGDYSFDNINHLFKLKTLSRIFEYYCLIKLQVAITQCGYVLQEVNKIIYDEDDIEDINNRYLFEGRGYKVTLLYEPYIWDNRIYDDIKLYSTRYNFIKHKWGDKWKPDFVIKVSSINQDYYYILDAKYSNLKNVERRYLPELVLKYGTQIASKDRFFSEIIGVGAIYPGEKHHIKYFKSNKINSSKVSLPQYFAMTLLNGENGNQAMISDIKELFKIIDEIELEFELEPTSTLNKKENIDYSLFNQDAEDGEQSNLDPIQNSVRVTGKRCFYFAKGVCLRHKKRCNIVNSPCEFYLSQNEGKLRTEKCDCRHLLQNKSRKRYTIHCDISEKNGCIGKDKCGFYVKVKR